MERLGSGASSADDAPDLEAHGPDHDNDPAPEERTDAAAGDADAPREDEADRRPESADDEPGPADDEADEYEDPDDEYEDDYDDDAAAYAAEPAEPSGRLARALSKVGVAAGDAAAGVGGRLGGLIATRRARRAARKAEETRESEEREARSARAAAVASRHYDHPRAAELSRQTAAEGRHSRFVNLDLEAMRANGMLTVDAERSVIAEEFRLVKRPLLLRAFAEGEDRIRHGNLIMVSSGRPGEGKTFCAINLAMSIALERDLTVMLIDADVAKPSVPSVMGFEAELGLIDLIADDGLDVSDVLVRTNIENLTILPAGRPHHLATELLASERMEQLIVELAERYPDRVIIIDSSPVLMSSVPGVLALYVGQTVFVVQAEKSTQSSIDAALGLISACENIYLLLNKTRSIGGTEKFGAYYGYYR